MEGVVKVISREFVKPSSQIHPKNLTLSYLDKLSPPIYIPVIFFYEADESKGLTASNHFHIRKKLKHSLSHTLNSFYPFAGRMEADGNVNCNDAGVEFIEARVSGHLVDALKHPGMENKLKQYIPIDVANPTIFVGRENPVLVMQITFFDCGGIVLGICFSHWVADCNSVMMFVNAWASTCRTGEIANQMVSFNLANHFPGQKIRDMGISLSMLNSKMISTKVIVFDEEKLALLKQNAVSSTVEDPTRVEVVSAFIWKFMLDKCTIKAKSTSFAAVHTVNLRAKKNIFENVFGNCIMLTSAKADEAGLELPDLVTSLRRSIRKIDDDYIRESQNGDNYVNDAYKFYWDLFAGGDVEGCIFSSWCRFPFYEVDYGFGTPILVCPAMPAKNAVVLVSSKCGENIQAWINMEQHIIEMLENQINLISGRASH